MIRFEKKLIQKIGVIKWYFSMLFCKRNILTIIAYNVIFIINIILNNEITTFNDLIILQFYGHGINYFNLIDFIGFVIYNGIPIYLISHFLEKEKNDRSIILNIRLKNKKQWFNSIIYCGILFIFTYICISLCISFIIGMSYGLFFVNGFNTINLKHLYSVILIAKNLELIFYFLVVFICYIYTKNSVVGFLLVHLGYFSYFLRGDIAKYTPIGMGALARMNEFNSEQGISCLVAVIILLIINILLYLYLRSGIYKKNFC